jgi:hypothetical protein
MAIVASGDRADRQETPSQVFQTPIIEAAAGTSSVDTFQHGSSVGRPGDISSGSTDAGNDSTIRSDRERIDRSIDDFFAAFPTLEPMTNR